MKIKKINFEYGEFNCDDYIEFEDGSKITYYHEQDCCEVNYADFRQLDDIALSADFDMDKLAFEPLEHGFRFGNKPNKMFFVPCYSEQNGYYSDQVGIYFNGNKVIDILECSEIDG